MSGTLSELEEIQQLRFVLCSSINNISPFINQYSDAKITFVRNDL